MCQVQRRRKVILKRRLREDAKSRNKVPVSGSWDYLRKSLAKGRDQKKCSRQVENSWEARLRVVHCEVESKKKGGVEKYSNIGPPKKTYSKEIRKYCRQPFAEGERRKSVRRRQPTDRQK